MNANNENIESNNAPKNDNIDIKKKFLKDFFGKKNEKDLIEFADNLYKGGGKIQPEIKQELDQFSRAEDIYKLFNTSTIKFFELSEPVKAIYAKVRNARENTKRFIFDNYHIEGNTYDTTIYPVLKTFDILTLRKIGSSRVELDKLLSQVFSNNLMEKPTPKFAWEFLKELNIEKRIHQVPQSRRKEVIYLIDKSIATPNALTESDIVTLFGLLNLSESERADVIQKYFPSISLDGAIKLGIKTKAEAKSIKEAFIQSVINDVGNFDTRDEEIQNLSRSIDLDDIYISTTGLSADQTQKILSSSREFKSIFTQETRNRGQYLKTEYKNTLSRNLGDFQKELETLGVISANKFQQGSFVQIQLGDKKETDNITTYYFEISDDGSKSGMIQIQDRGTGKYNSGQITLESEGMSYKNFLESFKTGFFEGKKVLSMQAYNPDEFKIKLKSGEIQEERDGPRFRQGGYYEQERKEKEAQLKEQGFSDEEIQNNEEIQSLKSKNEDIENIEELKIWLDKIDPEGSKFGIEKGITFSDKKYGFYEIIGFADGEIGIKNVFDEKQKAFVSYSDFYRGFKEGKLSRTSKSKTSTEMIQGFSNADGWAGFTIKDGKLLREEEVSDGHGHMTKKEIVCNYLVSEEMKAEDEVIKILKIDSTGIQVQFGSVEINRTEKKGEEIDTKSFSMESGKYTVSPGFLESWINLHKLKPKDDESKEIKEINTPHDHRQWSFVNWWSQGFSVHNILQGFHDIEHSIEHYFEGGQKEQNSKFAMKVMNLMPYNKIDIIGEIRESMRGDVEIEQKKRMDTAIEHLGGVDSGDAVKEILHWLHYNNTPDYKIHAGMMYMMKNYGVLYAKKGLIDLRGSFAWYKALGGKPNDAFFKKIQQECAIDDIPFSEEELVHKYLGLLGDQKKVRTRLHKEFKPLRDEIKRQEFEKGKKDGDAIRSLDGRNRGAMSELMGGTYPNALGFLKSATEKGTDIYKMNTIPFILGFSGIATDFDPIWTLDALKNFPAGGALLPIMRFLSYKKDIDLLGETILEVSKRIATIEGNPEIYSLALEIYNDRKSNSPKPFTLGKDTFTGYQAKIKRTEAFYKLYGTKVTDALYSLVDDNEEQRRSKYSLLIKTEKDAGIDLQGNQTSGNTVFQAYHNKLMGFSEEFGYGQKDVFNDAFLKSGMTGLDTHTMMTKVFELSQGGGFRLGVEADKAWESLETGIKNLAVNTYHPDPGVNDYHKKKIIKDLLRGIISGYFEKHGGQVKGWAWNVLKSRQGVFGYMGNWIDWSELEKADIPKENMKKEGSNNKFESLLDKFTSNVIQYESSKGVGQNSLGFSDLIQRTRNKTRQEANDNIAPQTY